MKNINHDSQDNSDLTTSYQIINNIPDKQAIVLQNTNENYPIQLKVNPVTDYGALWLTVLASVIVSAISAAVTIYLITKSNSKLSSNQQKMQTEMLNQQESLKINEVKSQNRQDWINKVRTIFVSYFDHTSSCYSLLNKNFAKKASFHTKAISFEDYNCMVAEYNDYSHKLNKIKYEVDITLSSTDKIDREIAALVSKYHEKFILLSAQLDTYYLSFSPNFKSIPMSYINQHLTTKEMDLINEDILKKIKELLKSEWEKVKKFE